MTNIKAQFGQVVKQYRVKQGLSQEKLAEKTGLHRTYISEVERGERNISLENIKKIAVSLDVNLSNIFLIIEQESD
jgi:transcriptional regulator with XRE-family HTH domain